jgi:hypothetical protein
VGAKGGQILAEAGVVSKTGRLARLGDRRAITYHAPRGEADVTKLTHTNPLIRARQAAIKKMLDRLPYEAPHIGEAARYAREAQRLPRQAAMRLTRSKEASAYRRRDEASEQRGVRRRPSRRERPAPARLPRRPEEAPGRR